MPAEPAPARLRDADREELARRLCRALYRLWLRQGGGHHHKAGDGAGDKPQRRTP